MGVLISPACGDPKSGFQSCSGPLVLVDESAEDIVATEVRGTEVFRWRQAIECRKVEAAMWPRPVVMLSVGAKNVQQVAPSEDEEVVEALSANGPHPSLRERVGPRSARWCLHHGEPLGPKDLVEKDRRTWRLDPE